MGRIGGINVGSVNTVICSTQNNHRQKPTAKDHKSSHFLNEAIEKNNIVTRFMQWLPTKV